VCREAARLSGEKQRREADSTAANPYISLHH